MSIAILKEPMMAHKPSKEKKKLTGKDARIRRLFVGGWSFTILCLSVIALAEFFHLDTQRNIVKSETQLTYVSSQQKTLIQKAALFGRLLTLTTNPNEQDALKNNLLQTADDLEAFQNRLVTAITEIKLYQKSPESLKEIYFDQPHRLDSHIREFISNARAFGETPNALIHADDSSLHRMTVISQSKIVNDGLDKIVAIHEEMVASHISKLHAMDIVLVIVRFSLFAILSFFVFVPLMKTLTKQFREYGLANQKLSQRTYDLRLANQAALNIMEDAEFARKKAENAMEAIGRLASIVTFSPDAIIGKTLGGLISNWNKGAEHLYGYTSDEAIGKPITILFPEDRQPEYEYFLERLKRGENITNHETVRLHKNGTRIDVELSLSPIYNEHGEFIGASTVARDIRSRKLMESKLRDYTEKLKQSNEELQKFANIVAHDLNEPVHKIVAFGDLIVHNDHSKLDPETKDYLERLKNATVRMGQLVDALLQYSRITARKRPSEEVPLNTIIDEVLSDIELRVKETHAQVSVESLPAIHGDPIQLRQLFQNLILNSIKFRKKEEPPQIRIQAHHGDARYVELEVNDNGIGFDDKFAAKIFSPFQQLHGRGVYEGLGMGLAICKKIVESHNGSITVKSQEGKGSNFFIKLPRA